MSPGAGRPVLTQPGPLPAPAGPRAVPAEDSEQSPEGSGPAGPAEGSTDGGFAPLPVPAFPAALRQGGGSAMRGWVAALGCALCCALVRGSEDIVVGCGGFVKSGVEINYSLIEVGAAGSLPPGPLAGRPAGLAAGRGLAPVP